MGCFSKGAHLPLVPTIPLVESTLDELRSSSSANSSTERLRMLQRSLRSVICSKSNLNLSQAIQSNLHINNEDILAHRTHFRVKKFAKRDSKNWEKDERRRRLEIEEKKKRRITDFHKQILDHREAFLRYHKQKRAG
jgi:hypothetical protein